MARRCKRKNIVLTGMFGAGKSTIGILLAKRTGRDFIDTDVLIQARQERTLQEILDDKGYLALRGIEEQTILACDVCNHIIATGGSAVYSDAAMRHLQANGSIVFLDTPLIEIVERVTDFDTRGIARRPGQSFEELFAERRPLYLRYADVVIDASGCSHDETADKVLAALAMRLGER
jgi:shikimate kinase